MAEETQGNEVTKVKRVKVKPIDKLTDAVVLATLEGKALHNSPWLEGEITQADRKRLAIIAGTTVEAFQERLNQKLKLVADKILDSLNSRVHELKPGELSFALSVAIDKAKAFDSQQALKGANVTQINHYHSNLTREELMAKLSGKKVVEEKKAEPPLPETPQPPIQNPT